MDTARYTKLFNSGYTLAKHAPTELTKLVDMAKDTPAIKEPLLAGELQYRKELVQAKMNQQGEGFPKKQEKGKGRDEGIDL